MKLKKSYIRDRINSQLINFVFKFCNFKNDGKIIVKSMDGIGDILVRSRLAELIVSKYGNENVYFLMKEQYRSLGEMLGYNVIGIPRKSEKNFFKRLKLMYSLNKNLRPKKFLNIEFGNDSTIANIVAEEKIGLEDKNEMVSYYNKYYTKSFTFSNPKSKVLLKIKDIAENILEEEIELKDIVPNLREKFKIEEKGIVIAVGTSSREKVCSPKIMKEYLKEVAKKFPNEEFILIGNGEIQKKYATYLENELKEIKILNYVDKTNLKEAFDIVAKSKLFIGFDSGLYNFCFVVRKKGIGVFGDTSAAFAHEVEWLKNIGPDKDKMLIEDSEYTNKNMNSISIENFVKGLEEIV